MTGIYLAAGMATLVLLLLIDGRHEIARDAKRWLLTRTVLLPGVVIASAAVVIASWFPGAAGAPGNDWLSPLAPGLSVLAFLLVAARFRQRRRSTSHRSR